MFGKTALVLGRAASVWDEIKAAKALAVFDAVIAINRMGRDYTEPFQHWVSYHPDIFPQWTRERKTPLPPVTYWSGIYKGQKLGDNKRLNLPIQYCKFSGGSSGLLALKVALDGLGFSRVVLAGVPMENTPRYDDRTSWTEANSYWDSWLAEQDWMAGRVRSMSGRTRKLLGAPDSVWLAGGKVVDYVGDGTTAAA